MSAIGRSSVKRRFKKCPINVDARQVRALAATIQVCQHASIWQRVGDVALLHINATKQVSFHFSKSLTREFCSSAGLILNMVDKFMEQLLLKNRVFQPLRVKVSGSIRG